MGIGSHMLCLLKTTLTILFLLLGPMGQAFILYASWGEEYRIENWMWLKGFAVFRVFPGLFLWILAVRMFLFVQVALVFRDSKNWLLRVALTLVAILAGEVPIVSFFAGHHLSIRAICPEST